MSDKKGTKLNVERVYRQRLLSGWSNYGQPENEISDSDASKSVKSFSEKRFFKSKKHQVFIPVVIEQISVDSDQHYYRVSINANSDLPITGYSERSKASLENAIAIPATGDKNQGQISLVYGVSEARGNTLSHSPGSDVQQAIAQIYSKFLVAIDRTIEFRIQHTQDEKPGDDTRGSLPPTYAHENVRANPKKGRSKALRAKIRAENTPEAAADVDEPNRQVLGGGLPDNQDGQIRVGNVTINRKTTT